MTPTVAGNALIFLGLVAAVMRDEIGWPVFLIWLGWVLLP